MTRPVTARRGVTVRVDSDEPAIEHVEPATEPRTLPPAVAGLARQLSPVTVGAVDDREEHQADAVATRVVAALRLRRGPASEPAGEPAARSAASLAALRRRAGRGATDENATTGESATADESATAGESATISRDGGPLSADTASQLQRARSGGVPLAPDTRAAFEPAIGADLGSVRLHVGSRASALNRQVGALAFTAGQDIFFRGGLPDVGTESGQHLLAHELAHAVSPEAGGPVRRAVVAQLHMEKKIDEDAGRITAVSIVGRPPPTFSNSMGDHTTAFTVHVNAVQLALIGAPLSEAAARMQDLVAGLNLTPGSTLLSGLPDRQARMLREAHERLIAVQGRLRTPTEGLDIAAAIQEYVAAYLELRELVPLSTINTGSVSKATAGKGKGEDCAALRGQASGIPQHPDLLAAEVLGLLDIRAVALACAETDPVKLAALVPGLPVGYDVVKRAALFVEQHLRTLQTAFPGALFGLAEMRGELKPVTGPSGSSDPRAEARARDELAIPLLLPGLLFRSVLPQAEDCLAEELPILLQNLESTRRQIRSSRPSTGAVTGNSKRKFDAIDSGKTSKKALQDLAKLEEGEKDLLARVNAIETALGYQQTPAMSDLPESETSKAPAEKRRSGRPRSVSVPFSPDAEDERQKSMAHEQRVQQQMKAMEAPPEPVDAEDLEEEAERKGCLAIQVIVDDAGAVTEVRSAGRPPSPFVGTMGAHTTAWIVHVDRIRQLVVGMSIDKALAAVAGLDDEREQMRTQLEPAFAFPEDSRHPAGSNGSDGDNPLLQLQHAIITHLEEVNLVPGAGMAAADVGGKIEGRHRRVLLEGLGLQQYAGNIVRHSAAEMLAAVVGLLDVGSLAHEAESDDDRFEELLIEHDEDPLGLLVTQHLVAIEASYPGALAAAGLPSSRAAAIKRVREETEKDVPKAKKPKGPPEKRTKQETVPDSCSPWSASLFGSLPKFFFDQDLDFTGSLLGAVGTTLAGRSKGAPVEGELLDDNGNLLDTELPRFRDAYLSDIARPGTYLAEAEGPYVADAFGIRVNVYRDRIPGGFTRVENIGNGDCLIHAASDIRAAARLEAERVALAEIPARLGPAGGRVVPGGEVSRIRGLASAGLTVDEDTAEHAVRDVVLHEVNGQGTQGLGPQLRALMRDRRLQHTAAVVRGRRLRIEAEKELSAREAEKKERARLRAEARKLARTAGSSADEVMPEDDEDTTMKEESSPQPVVVAPVVAPVLPVLPQTTYGTVGAISDNYALLHTGGNHYVALIRTG